MRRRPKAHGRPSETTTLRQISAASTTSITGQEPEFARFSHELSNALGQKTATAEVEGHKSGDLRLLTVLNALKKSAARPLVAEMGCFSTLEGKIECSHSAKARKLERTR
jgi:hypothetical protein